MWWSRLGWLLLGTQSALAVVYQPLQPPSYPLAVKNPYLSAWLPGDLVENLATSRAQFWAGAELTWSLMARVDGTTYNLFGMFAPPSDTQNATVVSATYTASHSTFVVNAGAAQLSLDFLSPVNPKDFVRQSIPFSYLTVSVLGVLNGTPTSIQIYSDIDDSWLGQNPNTFDQTSSWNFSSTEQATVWQLNNVKAHEYGEGGPNGNMALWGSAVYATTPASGQNLTIAGATAEIVRSAFVSNGTLANLGPTLPWSKTFATAFAYDLGVVASSVNVTFAIGFMRDCDVEYINNCRVAYYKSQYADVLSTASFFLHDYQNAQSQSLQLDSAIAARANIVAGSKYADIVALATRQTMGSIDITLPQSLNTSKVMIFMKEISSDGNVNTVDVIYPAFPLFYVLDVSYIRYLLEPIMQYLASGNWTLPYAIHDIGSTYPIANGHNDGNAEAQPIEESGNLLILAQIYSKAANDTTWAAQYQSVFQNYADYCAQYGLYPAKQLSTDDAAGPAANQTNLAIKAAVGLTSYGALFQESTYTARGQQFGQTIYQGGVGTNANSSHFTLQYGQPSSWTTTFNLFPDFLLQLNTFNNSAYEMQSRFYPTVRSQAGVALDSALDWTKTDWQLWAGATADSRTMKMMVEDVWTYLNNGVNTVPFSDRYHVSRGASGSDIVGGYYDFKARPVVGGVWSAMALQGMM